MFPRPLAPSLLADKKRRLALGDCRVEGAQRSPLFPRIRPTSRDVLLLTRTTADPARELNYNARLFFPVSYMSDRGANREQESRSTIHLFVGGARERHAPGGAPPRQPWAAEQPSLSPWVIWRVFPYTANAARRDSSTVFAQRPFFVLPVTYGVPPSNRRCCLARQRCSAAFFLVLFHPAQGLYPQIPSASRYLVPQPTKFSLVTPCAFPLMRVSSVHRPKRFSLSR